MLNTELIHGTVLSTHLTHYQTPQTNFAQSFGYQSYQDMFATLIPKFANFALRILNKHLYNRKGSSILPR